jgi:hypothetical protein
MTVLWIMRCPQGLIEETKIDFERQRISENDCRDKRTY